MPADNPVVFRVKSKKAFPDDESLEWVEATVPYRVMGGIAHGPQVISFVAPVNRYSVNDYVQALLSNESD